MKLHKIFSASRALLYAGMLTAFIGCTDKKTVSSEEVVEEPEIDTTTIVQPDTAEVQVKDTIAVISVDTIKAEAIVEEEVTEDTFTHDPDLLASLKNNDGAHLTGPKTIYLTFDDGPSAITPKILKVLRENGVHATFFVTAQNKACLHYIKEAFQDGNAIAVHSYTHNFRTIYTDQLGYFEDLEKMNDVIEEQTGQRSHIIRFPGGSSNTVFLHYNKDPQFMLKLMKEVLNRGYQYVDWNADSRDASTNRPTAELVASSACHASKADLCLLMHDLQSKEGTLKALPSIIKYFKEKGYEFGTLTSTEYVNHHDPERSYRQALNMVSGKKG